MKLTYRHDPEITIDSDNETFTIGNTTYTRRYFYKDDEGCILAALSEDLIAELPNTEQSYLLEDKLLISELMNEA
jgi:hypothetical protein